MGKCGILNSPITSKIGVLRQSLWRRSLKWTSTCKTRTQTLELEESQVDHVESVDDYTFTRTLTRSLRANRVGWILLK